MTIIKKTFINVEYKTFLKYAAEYLRMRCQNLREMTSKNVGKIKRNVQESKQT